MIYGYTIKYRDGDQRKETFMGDPIGPDPVPPEMRLPVVLAFFMETRPRAEVLSIYRSKR